MIRADNCSLVHWGGELCHNNTVWWQLSLRAENFLCQIAPREFNTWVIDTQGSMPVEPIQVVQKSK